MRKTLSLKKTSALPLKNQTAITQFFKNDHTISQVQQNRILGERQIQQSNTISSCKRKTLDDEGILVEPPLKEGQDEISNNSFKKIKHDTISISSNIFNNKVKKSPQKENFANINNITADTIVDTSIDENNGGLSYSKEEIIGNKNKISKYSASKLNHKIHNIDNKELIINQHKEYVKKYDDKHTPNNSPAKDGETPVASISPFTPEKVKGNELSPSKKGSTVKVLTFKDNIQNLADEFEDEWDLKEIDEEDVEDLDLSVIQKCEVLHIISQPTRLELKLKNTSNNKGTCYIEGIWAATPLLPGDNIAVIATQNSTGDYCINNTSGLLVLRPDYLMSSTSVVAGVFCKRKAILQECWRGLDSANSAMTIGIIIHELVQKALIEKISSLNQINKEVEIIMKESKHLLYDAGLGEEEVRNNILMYISPLIDFMGTYFNSGTVANMSTKAGRDNWNGCINKVLDIEENLCCPQLGLKGKIDATLQVTVKEKGSKQAIVPLELKSGKASLSAEHRGQVVLYGMMLAALRKEDPSRADQRGLLLYLKNNVELREVSCGYPERRDLMMLRNQLVQYLAAGPQDVNPGKTQTICVLIQMLVALKQRVLVYCSISTSAVDTVLSRLPKTLKVMRLGATSRIAESLANRSERQLTANCSTVQELEALYNSMEVVGVTCLGAAHAVLSRTCFDVCIVDEATQVLQSTVLRPLFAAKRFVLVGDPEQLPPVVRSKAARRMGMEESLFHRLMSDEATISLRLQYRMNQTLADLANRVAYGGLLKCAGDAVANSQLNIDIQSISALTEDSAWLSIACSPKPEHAAVFVDLKSQKQDVSQDVKNCTNKVEASVVISLAETLIQGGIKSSDIGVIAPFRDQVALLKRSLAGLAEVSTVDQFQGKDKPVIIYSCTKKEEQNQKTVREGEVLSDQRRLAVSVTRAKHKLIVVGSSSALQRYKPLQKLIDACALVVVSEHETRAISAKYRSRVM
ncbi:hypothetical protein ACJJTC_005939 [Scirpophaga incertulas]